MITTKELSFVSSWASKAPYPGIKYATQTIEKLINAVDDYDKFYANKEYDLILSNGEQILFEILSMNLCHMLGVEYKNLTCEYFEDFRKDVLGITGTVKSYDLLKAIIANADEVLKYDCDKKGKILNYYRIMIKCSIFEKLSDFSRFNFGVINFDKNKYESLYGTRFNGRSEKFLYVQSNEAAAPYFMMGILPDDKIESTEYVQKKYAVETLIAPDSPGMFFSNQEVVIPTQILVTTSNSMEKLEATPNEKIALLNQYKSIIKNYGLNNCLNIYGDYESMLACQSVESQKSRIKVK